MPWVPEMPDVPPAKGPVVGLETTSPKWDATGESLGMSSPRVGIAVLGSARNVQMGYTRMYLWVLVPTSLVPLALRALLLCFMGFLCSPSLRLQSKENRTRLYLQSTSERGELPQKKSRLCKCRVAKGTDTSVLLGAGCCCWLVVWKSSGSQQLQKSHLAKPQRLAAGLVGGDGSRCD